MKIKNNLFNPLPIFDSKEEWYSNKETYKGKKQPTLTQRNYILPMQLVADGEVRMAINSSSLKIHIQPLDSRLSKELIIGEDITVEYGKKISDSMAENNEMSLYIGGDYLVNKNMQVGTYYLTLSIGKNVWYSDLFTMVDNTDKLLHIKYRNSTTIEGADAFMPFATIGETRYMDIYLDATLMMPEFHFESEETITDGYKRVSKRVSYKTLQTKFFCTEYMAEALRMLWHCDRIQAWYRGSKYIISDVDIQVSWDMDNHFCTVQMKMTVDNILQTNASSTEYAMIGDFNKDYNEDYKKY